ncbi:nucleotidyltransferase domain-containing protein [Nonomuraea salmonea]|uniref:nucleotidyltransferase domain-containing protein n=1 Tax=Nonomuraea salmonea TaxID=46181 RepID=UPI0031EA0890
MTPHPKIDAIVETYLSVADAEAPGLVEGLYLEGSAALGDYRPDTSDIDFVAVTTGPPAPGVLERIHTRLGAHPFEGVYLTWDDLGHDPAELGERPPSEGRQAQPTRRAESRHLAHPRPPRPDLPGGRSPKS